MTIKVNVFNICKKSSILACEDNPEGVSLINTMVEVQVGEFESHQLDNYYADMDDEHTHLDEGSILFDLP